MTNHKLNKKEWKNAGKSFYFIEKYAGAKNRQICKKWVLVIILLVCMTSLQMNTAVVGTHLGPSLHFWYMPIPYMPYLYLWLYRFWIRFCLNYILLIVSLWVNPISKDMFSLRLIFVETYIFANIIQVHTILQIISEYHQTYIPAVPSKRWRWN